MINIKTNIRFLVYHVPLLPLPSGDTSFQLLKGILKHGKMMNEEWITNWPEMKKAGILNKIFVEMEDNDKT